MLKSKAFKMGGKKVGKALREINPDAQARRQQNAGRPLNPKIYNASYFGHKLHFDQNEKLRMFGAVHVCARDGFSGVIIGCPTIPVKNNIVIYEEITGSK